MFAVGTNDRDRKCPSEAYLSRELGDALVNSYFDIIHPQNPILTYSEIMESWDNYWKPPNQHGSDSRGEILFMVLALGARVSSSQGQQDVSLSEGWADHFARKASDCMKLFEDSSLRTTQFFFLKLSPFAPQMNHCLYRVGLLSLSFLFHETGYVRLPGHET